MPGPHRALGTSRWLFRPPTPAAVPAGCTYSHTAGGGPGRRPRRPSSTASRLCSSSPLWLQGPRQICPALFAPKDRATRPALGAPQNCWAWRVRQSRERHSSLFPLQCPCCGCSSAKPGCSRASAEAQPPSGKCSNVRAGKGWHGLTWRVLPRQHLWQTHASGADLGPASLSQVRPRLYCFEIVSKLVVSCLFTPTRGTRGGLTVALKSRNKVRKRGDPGSWMRWLEPAAGLFL